MIKRIIKIYICVFLIIVFFCSCKEEIQLSNIKLAIDYDSYFSEYDDQLYELNEDGTLTVSLCRIRTRIGQKLIIANDYNGEGEMTTCKFEEKKIKLTYKQKRIIFDIWSKLSEEEPFRKQDAYHYLGSNKKTDATVYIQLGDKITYACTYIDDYEKAERKESEMGIYEERLQEVSIYGERSSEISSGRSCHLRSSRLSVLSEPAGTAVYASPAGTFFENTEKEMHCSPEKKSELSVP